MRERDIERSLQRSARHLNNLDDLDDLFDAYDVGVGSKKTQKIETKEQRTESHTRGRLTEEVRERLEREQADEAGGIDRPEEGDRWNTWSGADARGPDPLPDWVITEDAAVDTELGVLKTGKEADVHLVERFLPSTGERNLLAAKRYRGAAHRLFHRDASYLEGRRLKESREQRAVENRTKFGRNLIAQKWALAEFEALGALWAAGLPVPYPVQRIDTELLVEFVGDNDGTAAPRLAEIRADSDELADLWAQLVDALTTMARLGYAHGDLSAYNLLVHSGELILIDLPQLVDVVANPQGPAFLDRDVRNVHGWFRSHGLPEGVADPDKLVAELLTDAGLG